MGISLYTYYIYTHVYCMYYTYILFSNLIWYLGVSENENLPQFIRNFQAISMEKLIN